MVSTVVGYSLLTNRCKVFSQGTAALRTATGVSGELSHKAKGLKGAKRTAL